MASVTIGSNISSLQAQRRLGESSALLAQNSERLSSGLRINRASDDAAGLAIASSLNANGRVFTQGVRNLNDGISYLSVAEGGLSELKSIIIRSKELAQQSANGVYSDTQRLALDREAQTLAQEYNRILEGTSFNGQRVFSQFAGTLRIQAGYGVNGSITSNISSTNNRTNFTIKLTSTSSNGVEGDGESSGAKVSADGRYIVFESSATNLVAGDTNGQSDIFRKDLQTGEIVRVSTSNSGAESDNNSGNAAISYDGRYVVFQSLAENLVAGDANSSYDIFRKDLQTGEILRVSTNNTGTEGNNYSTNATISADGRYVSFESDSSNLVTGDINGFRDIFRKDLQTGEIIRASTSSSGIEEDGDSYAATISADGRYIVFESTASNLVSGDTNSVQDIFRKDLQTGEVLRVSTSYAGGEGNAFSYKPSISNDGRYVAFHSSSSNLVDGDINGQSDIFRKDLQTGELIRVSTSQAGVQGNANSRDASISSDGRYIAFGSRASNIVNGSSGSWNYYIKDIQTGNVALYDVGDSNDNTFFGSISSDGRYLVGVSDGYSSFGGGGGTGIYNTFIATNTLIDQNSTTRLTWFNLKTQSEAKNAITWLDNYLEEISQIQGQVGVSQSRFQTAVSTLGSTIENYKAAEGRIKDVDVAAESANYVRNQILQQVAASVLGQANQAPALAIQLIR